MRVGPVNPAPFHPAGRTGTPSCCRQLFVGANMKVKENRTLGFAVIAAVYTAAAVLGVLVYRALGVSWVPRLLLADVAATLLVFIASLLLDNASVYDPYWSVAPLVMLPLCIANFGVWTPGSVALLVCVGYWGVRLTANWTCTFQDLTHQDWRYTMLLQKSGAWYPLVCLFGIMLFPTLVVFMCLLPALFYIQIGAVNALTLLGFAVCLLAATLQLAADLQMHRFRKSASGHAELIRTGLWTHARHPNYLGEILMWWGVATVLLSVRPALWYLCAGAAVNTLMFLFISIPMAEKRLAGYKDGFAKYKKQTNMLLPFPLRRG